MSQTNTSLSTNMSKPLQVSVGCQTQSPSIPTASDLGGAERRQLLARIADLEAALAAANAKAFFGDASVQTQSSRPNTSGSRPGGHHQVGGDSWEPAQTVFGQVPFQKSQQGSGLPSTRGSTPSLRPDSRGYTPDAGAADRLPPRSPNNTPSSPKDGGYVAKTY